MKSYFARAKLIQYYGNNWAMFECPEHHRFRKRLMPKAPNGRSPSEEICARWAAYWMRTGVKIDPKDCPKCRRAIC